LARPKLEVADIFRRHGPAWRQANAGHVSLGQLKVMSAIESCRTAALGGHVHMIVPGGGISLDGERWIACLPLLRQPHAHHRDPLAGATAQCFEKPSAPPDAAAAEGQDRHLMTISQPPPRKAVRSSARSSAGHGSARSNAAFTTLQPHRSSPTHRPGDHKNASHPSCNVIPTAQPTLAADLSYGPPTAKSP
jgi:hypothetical protein